jgi:hypothetical protein
VKRGVKGCLRRNHITPRPSQRWIGASGLQAIWFSFRAPGIIVDFVYAPHWPSTRLDMIFVPRAFGPADFIKNEIIELKVVLFD